MLEKAQAVGVAGVTEFIMGYDFDQAYPLPHGMELPCCIDGRSGKRRESTLIRDKSGALTMS